jgi:hypothetical protein
MSDGAGFREVKPAGGKTERGHRAGRQQNEDSKCMRIATRFKLKACNPANHQLSPLFDSCA